MTARSAKVDRETRETHIRCSVTLDTDAANDLVTGVGFLDHLLDTLARHGGFGLTLHCEGDLHVDDHHTAEDCALVLGTALDQALGERRGIERFGYAYAPLDEALARAVVDLSGRPASEVNLGLTTPTIGELSSQMVPHVIRSLAQTLRASIHVDVLRGVNDHHRAEAAFKALALALRQAMRRGAGQNIPSTKGVL